MIRYAKGIVHSLKVNTVLQSLTLCISRNSVGRYKDMVVKANCTKSNVLVIDGNLCFSTLTDHDNAEEVADKVVNIRILYDAYDNGEHLCDAVSLSNKRLYFPKINLLLLR